MPKVSHAKLLGINMRELWLEHPTHEKQIRNRTRAENKSAAYWAYRRVLDANNPEALFLLEQYEEKYASEMPAKTKKYDTVVFVPKGGANGID